MKTAVVDIETDNLLLDVTTIHCIGVKIIDDEIVNDTVVFTSNPIRGSCGLLDDCMALLKKCDRVVFHNGIKFDMPVIKKILGIDLWDYCDIYDTLLAGQLAYPNLFIYDNNNSKIPKKLKGSYSLEAWGYRLGNYKEHYDDWSKLTEEMVEYCRQDIEVTYSLYKKLLIKDIPKEAVWLENNFARIIQRQEEYGVLFDIKKAQQLHIELLKDKEQLEKQLQQTFKPLKDWKPLREVNKYTKDGSVSKVWQKQVDNGACYNDDMEWGRWIEVRFNPSSRHHIARWLKEVYGWTPTEFTEKDNIIINEGVLKTLDFPEGKLLAHYFEVNKLIGQLAEGKQAWLKQVRQDSRIHGQVNTIGAVSRRCTHSNPNLAQTPSPRAFKGKECRELFIVPKDRKLVGCDASGLELRTLAHYLAKYDKGAYGRAVVSGDKSKGTDVHTLNQKAAGLPTRDDAKTFVYAFLYGAGVDKLGSITGGGAKEGAILKKKFLAKLPALKQLIDAVQKAVKTKGYLKALDGNKFYIRSPHSALNTLLQGCGALIMKYWLIEYDKALQAKGYKPYGIDYEFVLNIHDEAQCECRKEIADDVSKIAQEAFLTITKQLKFRVKLEGEAKIGDNWYETH